MFVDFTKALVREWTADSTTIKKAISKKKTA